MSNEVTQPKVTRVAVYGSLRRGFHNNLLLNGAEYLGKHVVPEGFRMISLGSFPAVIPAEDDSTGITVEVYSVDHNTLCNLDGLEGHPDWYKRQKVETPYKRAWMYVMPKDGYEDRESVESGDWSDFYVSNY